MDFGGNCVEGLLSTLINFYPFANYIVASDLNVGGYDMDEWTPEKWNEVSASGQLGERFRPEKHIIQALVEIGDLQRKRWEYSRNSMVENRVPQSRAVFDTLAFSDFVHDLYSPQAEDPSLLRSWNGDLYELLLSNEELQLAAQLRSSLVYFVSNRDFFEWPAEAFGVRIRRSDNALLTIRESSNGSAAEIFGQQVFRIGTTALVQAEASFAHSLERWHVVPGLGEEVESTDNPLTLRMTTATEVTPSFTYMPVAPSIHPGGVVGAPSSSLSVLTPGGLVSVYGSEFTDQNYLASLPLGPSLGGVSIVVNDRLAPVLFASRTQVNVQVPFETQLGTARVVVRNAFGVSDDINVGVASSAPDVFEIAGHAIAQNDGIVLNSPHNPAPPGSHVVVYFTGGGLVKDQAAVSTGLPTPFSLHPTLDSASASLGGEVAKVVFAGLTPGFVGLYQANIVVPSLAAGQHLLALTLGESTSPPVILSVSAGL